MGSLQEIAAVVHHTPRLVSHSPYLPKTCHAQVPSITSALSPAGRGSRFFPPCCSSWLTTRKCRVQPQGAAGTSAVAGS